MKRDRLPLRQKNLGQNSMEEKNLGKISIETKNFESGFHWDKKIWDKVPDLELEIFWKNFPMRQNFLRKVSIETKYFGTGFLVLGHLSLESGGKGTISCWDKMQLGQKKLGQISVFFKFLGSKYEGTKCFWDTFLRKDFLWVSLLWDRLPRDDYQGPHYRAPNKYDGFNLCRCISKERKNVYAESEKF